LLDEVVDNVRQTNWKIDYPAGSVHLVGSKYKVKETKYRDITVYTYFFPESQDLAESYLNACKRYLAMYEAMIGPYPFSKFAVVENFFPTGYGMPSFTLLGSQVIRLPFIIYTSLGHEVAHNWWGNSVYIDYDSGNWCEGLTTYFADHHYKEMKNKSEAALYRRDLNRDFTVYVKDQKDFPLQDFSERTESASRAIGYGKSALLFHQLRQIIGDSLFYKSFQTFYNDFKFKDASWQDIRKTAERVSKQNLNWFFSQWLERKGAPQVQLSSVLLKDKNIEITLSQVQEGAYRLYVPIEVVSGDSTRVIHRVWLEDSEQTFQLPVEGEARKITVDPDYDLLRKLERDEIPPTLSEIFSKEEALIILPDNCTPTALQNYKKFAETMSEGVESIKITDVSNLSDTELQEKSLYLLGTPKQNSIINKVAWGSDLPFEIKNNQIQIHGNPIPGTDDVSALVARRPNSTENICIISFGENQQTGRIANLISHYGKYSYLLFTGGKNKIKEIFPVYRSPMVHWFDQN
jgi:aminopeptidase N